MFIITLQRLCYAFIFHAFYAAFKVSAFAYCLISYHLLNMYYYIPGRFLYAAIVFTFIAYTCKNN